MVKREDLDSTFGWFEFEKLAFDIINFLGEDLSLSFDRNQVTDDETLFAMFAASGWIDVNWFMISPAKVTPTDFRKGGTFTLSKAFIQRLKTKNININGNKEKSSS